MNPFIIGCIIVVCLLLAGLIIGQARFDESTKPTGTDQPNPRGDLR